jgi:hypothetical protein
VEVHPTDHPIGGRFLNKPYPKSRRSRRFRLDPTLHTALADHINDQRLSPDNRR